MFFAHKLTSVTFVSEFNEKVQDNEDGQLEKTDSAKEGPVNNLEPSSVVEAEKEVEGETTGATEDEGQRDAAENEKEQEEAENEERDKENADNGEEESTYIRMKDEDEKKIAADFYYNFEEFMSKARVTEGSGLPSDLLSLQYPLICF